MADDEILKEYAVANWPVTYAELDPFFNVAEVLLGVSGSREAVAESTLKSNWYKKLSAGGKLGPESEYQTTFPFPCPPIPMTPVGAMCAHMMQLKGFSPVPLPASIVSPGSKPYSTRAALEKAFAEWPDGSRPDFWKGKTADQVWSERVRQACTQCGFCGEYLCWGREAPKAGMAATTLKEMAFDLAGRCDIRPNAMAYEILWKGKPGSRASGVKYLDIADPDQPRVREIRAENVILSCGSIQSARLLLMSMYQDDNVGRHVMFHMFGLGVRFALEPAFDGLVRGEFGATGNTTTFDTYFVEARPEESPTGWVKAGIMTSTAKKNPTEDAAKPFVQVRDGAGNLTKPNLGAALLTSMESHSRNVELRLNGDDLPHPDNRVTLDPMYVDEFGLPAARITRKFFAHENRLNAVGTRLLGELVACVSPGIIKDQAAVKASKAVLSLIGDHQLGTCRMGDDEKTTVLDRWCRTHQSKNLYVVDTSCFPTGFGVNPMVTVVANALRVGTAIVDGKGVIQE